MAEPHEPSSTGALGDGTGPHAFVADLDAPVLEPDDHHHLARVLRVREGEAMTVSDGRGRWRACRFGAEPVVDGPVHAIAASQPPLTIGFALVKGERPELIVQKLTELGVDRIVPFVAARSVVRPDPARQGRQAARWNRVAREAAMQCRRAWLPLVDEPVPFADALALPGAVAADRFGAPPSLEHPVVLVGPEGGWSSHERAAFRETVALGEHVLRTETACIAAASILVALRAGLVAPAGLAN